MLRSTCTYCVNFRAVSPGHPPPSNEYYNSAVAQYYNTERGGSRDSNETYTPAPMLALSFPRAHGTASRKRLPAMRAFLRIHY